MDEAIKTADFVVIPTLSSPIDLQQTMLTAAQCQDAVFRQINLRVVTS